MAETEIRGSEKAPTAGFGEQVERLDRDLEIMERHANVLAQEESELQDSMRKWDREYKDARLHSIPRPRKHTRP
jgi:phosphoserine phosphatase